MRSINRDLVFKFAPTLRKLKYIFLWIRSYAKYKTINRLRPASRKGVIVLLSLGGAKGSHFVANAVEELGYDLAVASNEFPRYEGESARHWIQCDPLGDYETLNRLVSYYNPIAVLVEQRNILLPIKAKLNSDLGLVDYGMQSHKTSNSKIEFRKAIDASNAPNIRWCLLDDYTAESFPFPFVLKPEKGTGSRGITIIEKPRDMEQAKEKLNNLAADETVGGRIMLEGMIEGRQFDVEGVYRNGTFYPLSVTEEQYDRIDGALPSAWYLFSPPIDDEYRTMLLDAAETFTRALGVRNGAFHCEMRVNSNGDAFAIDYANRMGYPLLVSKCAGVSFPAAYVRAMVGEAPPTEQLQRNTIFQRFIRDTDEFDRYQTLMRENPRQVIQKNILGSYIGGVKTYGRVALQHDSYQSMVDLLAKYDVVPIQWKEYYN